MKKYAIVAVILVLTVSMLTGCGCTAQDSDMATMPSTEATILPTNIPETTAPMETETEPMTMPATDSSETSGADETTGMGGETQDNGTTETGAANRSRMH